MIEGSDFLLLLTAGAALMTLGFAAGWRAARFFYRIDVEAEPLGVDD